MCEGLLPKAPCHILLLQRPCHVTQWLQTDAYVCFYSCQMRPLNFTVLTSASVNLSALCTIFFLSPLTGSIWFPDPCVIPLSSFVRSRTNSIVHGDCFHWFFHCPPSHKSNKYCVLPYSPSYTRLLPNNVTLLRGTRGYPRAPVGIWPIWDTVAGLTYHYALTLRTSHILINWIIAIHGWSQRLWMERIRPPGEEWKNRTNMDGGGYERWGNSLVGIVA